jgi:hypothetical protein
MTYGVGEGKTPLSRVLPLSHRHSKVQEGSPCQRFGPAFALDSKGNAKAVEFVSMTGKKPLFIVVISGTMSETKTLCGSGFSVKTGNGPPASGTNRRYVRRDARVRGVRPVVRERGYGRNLH